MSTPESQQQFGSLLTVAGENAEQNGKLQNKQISFTHIAIGDANDDYVQPERTQSALVNELHRIAVNTVDVLQATPDSVPMLKVEAVLPDDVTGLVIREFAAIANFNGREYIHAVGNCARIYVPSAINNGGVATPVTIEMLFVITSADPIVEIDPHLITASRAWVNGRLKTYTDRFLDAIEFGADNTGKTDTTDKVNAYIEYIINNSNKADNGTFSSVSLIFPPGLYSVSSVNLTGLRGYRNINIQAQGAVFQGNTDGVDVIDMIGSRWVWIYGASVTNKAGITPRSGIQMGPVGVETCGNNKLFSVQSVGRYSRAALCNYGSETTQYYSCRFVNNSDNRGTFAGVFDGAGVYTYDSKFKTVTRGAGVDVSFTANASYGCQYKHVGQGQAIFLSKTDGHIIDKPSYLLCYTGAGVVAYNTNIMRNKGLEIRCLCETSKKQPPKQSETTGLQYILEVIGDGSKSAMNELVISVSASSYHVAAIKNSSGGCVKLENAKLRISGHTGDRQPRAFDVGAGIAYTGVISMIDNGSASGIYPNLADLLSFNGSIYVESMSRMSTPSGAFSIYESATNALVLSGISDISFSGWTPAAINRDVIEVYGRLNTIELSPGQIVSSIKNTSRSSEITIRTSGNGSLKILHDPQKIRTTSGADVMLYEFQSMTFIDVGSGIWQQVAGYY